MRTANEILAELDSLEASGSDFFGFIASDLIGCLPYKEARPFLKEGVTEAEWKPEPTDRDSVVARIQAYMEFAWGKANDRRGLSAARSLDHMRAWLWLAGEDDLHDAMMRYDHTHYGKPALRAICEHFGWDWAQWDDDRWTSSELDEGVPANEVERLDFEATT